MRVPLQGGAYESRSIIASSQRCVNLYPEANPSDSPCPYTYYPTAGTTLLTPSPVIAPMRCLYTAGNGDLYCVVGNNVYYINASWQYTLLGQIVTFSNPCSMADNGIVLVLVDGSPNGYCIDLTTSARTFGTLTSQYFYGADKVDYLDTFFIFNRPNTQQWYTSLSEVNFTMLTTGDQAFDGTYIVAKSGYADLLTSLVIIHREIVLLGKYTTEIWYNSGAADFPFQIQSGVFIQHGCVAKYSISSQALNVFFLSEDKQGHLIVMVIAAYQAQKISTYAIEQEFSTYSTYADAIGFTYQEQGHTFYVLNFPTQDKTWVYDIELKLWHERAWLDADGNLHKIRPNCVANAYGEIVCGDWENGNLYSMDVNNYTDNGNPIPRIRSFPHQMNDDKRVVYNQFIADMECGADTVSDNPVTVPIGNYLETNLKSVCLIPGAGEFVYSTVPITDSTNNPFVINQNTSLGKADVLVALDQLQQRFPNLQNITVVVGWFGNDQRLGNCTIQPGVEQATRTTSPLTWWSGGVQRSNAHLISIYNGGSAYGGTPSDDTIVALIAEIKSRGLNVTLYPFLFMDIPSTNSLPNPYGGTGQGAYPWRGTITCYPAIGQGGTVDKTSACTAQVNSFFGIAQPSNFSIGSNGQLSYTGTADWGFNKFILYYAQLVAKRCGGVNTFIMGSEMAAASIVRDSQSDFPFVNNLITLAVNCRSILGTNTTLTYGADWSEYFGYHASDGSNDVYFHLDPLWASSSISAVGIDFYAPLADWRNTAGELDQLAGYAGPYQRSYIDSNIEGGEDYSWYYASTSARNSQTRSTITDGAYSKPWVYSAKDFRNWWLNSHYNRPAGVESISPTAWIPQSKPIMLTEFGCGAIDKGSNQPNKFSDPKSSTSGIPYYSTGVRDDMNQRVCLEAMLAHYANSPMLSTANMSAWCWDARPFPQFPTLINIWGDGGNYATGQWLEGRAVGTSIAASSNNNVYLRCSRDRGRTYGNAILQNLGNTANFLANVQFRRLGMARDMVFELSWSVPVRTALNGAFVDVIGSGT